MQASFSCPLCGRDSWESVGRFTYEASEHGPKGVFAGDAYASLRRRILFEVWFPGQDRVELGTQFCRSCGFFCYSPRPEAADIDAKYAFLSETEVDIGAAKAPTDQVKRLDRQRGRDVFARLEATGPVSGSVLDIGGGDGKLMAPFHERGCSCHIVDYNPHPVEGVERLGNTVADIPDVMSFDLVTCCHVLEHVADPVQFLRDARQTLATNGRAYFEVPVEIWKDVPIRREPVTHVNFFTLESLKFAMRRAGFKVMTGAFEVGWYAGQRILIAWAIGGRDESSIEPPLPGDVATRSLVNPSSKQLLYRAAIIEPKLERSLAPYLRLPVTVLRRLLRKD